LIEKSKVLATHSFYLHFFTIVLVESNLSSLLGNFLLQQS
jgi:hypothetical protein